MTLWDDLEATVNGRTSLHCWVDGAYRGAPWREVLADATRTTRGLRAAGVRPGDRVAGILTNSPDAVRGILGVWLAGGVLASLPLPARGLDLAEYGRQVERICDQLDATVLVVDRAWTDLVPESLRRATNVISWDSVADSGTIDPSPPGDDDVAFIQYSSGSTGDPKGCMLTARAIANQIGVGTEDVFDLRPGLETGVSWLPLSHDMGLFGALLQAWIHDVELFLSTPERFVMSPRTWFADIASTGATITMGTNTALDYATRPYRKTPLDGQLQLRAFIIGAERVEWESLMRAVEVFGPNGFTERCLMPSYGMAEATLGVTATRVHEMPRHLVIDAVALADGIVEEVDGDHRWASRIVSAGRPCAGVRLPGLTPDVLSEVRVESESLATGYYANPELSAARFVDGGVLTGDLAIERDDHLYIVGRTDDMIKSAGRTVYAREIELAVDRIEGARRGCSTIVEHHREGRARLTLLVEPVAEFDEYDAIANRAADLAMAKAAVPLDDCVFLPPGAVPKTPSGKIQRHRCVQLLDTDQLEPLATVALRARTR